MAPPPIHQPAQSLSVFEVDAPLDPIPLGIGLDGVVSWDPQGRSGLQVVGGTGSGTSEFNWAMIEQCRTRGWRVLIADGFGPEFVGFRGTANVSYVSDVCIDGEVRFGDYLTTVQLAHSIVTRRREASRHSGRGEGFAPLLLVLGEVAGPMSYWQHGGYTEQYRQVHTMVDDLLCAEPELRCYVLISPASGWEWRLPWSTATRCDTVMLGKPERPYLAHCSDPAATLEAVKAALGTTSWIPRGRGAFLSANHSIPNPVVFQSFLTPNPCSDFSRHPYPPDITTQWEQFRAAVSDKTPALHPQLFPGS
ncbi:hypothetical protein B5P44_00025 [Mycobacterium sp. CBMA 213]|uniref:hypothetical protein n=1 Tax=Mycolicibacterium sp. CBMA 213 TaxID=1968788 RepID=UPI00155D8C5B|nr:hypothetical protein [Mycolicibacterium sp. CBMA 213]MUM03209.1 hypothetical protein [Mycolicibacterium sp. CBMA 213]